MSKIHIYVLTTIVTICFSLSLTILIISLKPINVSKVVIKENGRTIVFQGMTHAAKPIFYHKVRQELIELRLKKYTVLYEGISASNIKNSSKTCNISISNGLISQPTFSENINLETDTNVDKGYAIKDAILNSNNQCKRLSIVDVRIKYRLEVIRRFFKSNIRDKAVFTIRDKRLLRSALSKKGNILIIFGNDHMDAFLLGIKKYGKNAKIVKINKVTAM